jgi:hypothetical protein
MDAMQHDGPTETVPEDHPDARATVKAAAGFEADQQTEMDAAEVADAADAASTDEAPAEIPDDAPAEAVAESAPDVPQPRSAEPEPASAESGGKGKKRKAAPRAAKSPAGTKALVVFRDGKVHYADESVVVLDLDEAAHPDTDVHDVVDKLSELRDAAESAGRAEAVALVAELIQAKALA